MTLRSVLILLMFAACARAPAASVRVDGAQPWAQQYADDMAADLDLAVLSRQADPLAKREIRIWVVSGGWMVPEGMVHIVELENDAVGHRYTIWPLEEGGRRAPPRHDVGLLDEAGWRRRAGESECREVRSGTRFVACEARATYRFDWRAVIAKLDSLAVHRGPAAAGCPPGLDGWETIVELRTPTVYTQYHCWSPDDASRDPDARRIGQIQRIAWRGIDR